MISNHHASIVCRSDEIRIKDIDKGVKNSWRWDWLEKDVDGIYLHEYIRKIKKAGFAYCTLCDQELKYASRGFVSLSSHVKSTKHKAAYKIRKENFSLPGVGDHLLKQASADGKYGLHPMFKNVADNEVKKAPKAATPLSDRVANSEAMLLAFMAEKSLPFSMAEDLLDFTKALSEDRKAFNAMALHRTTASYKMRFGLAKTFQENLIDTLKQSFFSLNIDESVSNAHEKIVSVLCNFSYTGKIVTKHLSSFSIIKGESKVIFDAIVDIFEKNEIPWRNLMSVLLDSCNVMRGRNSGLETRIREKSPHLLDIDGDSCHHVHNAAKKFCDPFDRYLEGLIIDIHNDFKWSADLRVGLSEICLVLNTKYTVPQTFVSFRWLSLYDCAQDLFRMMDALILFYFSFLKKADKVIYLSLVVSIYHKHHVSEAGRDYIRHLQASVSDKIVTKEGRARKERIILKLIENYLKTKLICSFLISVLPLLKEFVKLFQSNAPLIHILHDKQVELLKSFLGCFVRPEVLARCKTASKLKKLKVEKTVYHLNKSSMFVGDKVKSLVSSSNKKNSNAIKEFHYSMIQAYVKCAKTLLTKLPICNNFLRCVSSINPRCRQKSVALKRMLQLSKFVTNVLKKDEYDQFSSEVHAYHAIDLSLNKNLPVDQFWYKVKDDGRFPLLSKVALACLTCFHGPKVEATFSLMNNIITPGTSRINVTTYDALQSVRYELSSSQKTAIQYFKKNDFLHDPINGQLSLNFKSAAKLYVKEKSEKKEHKMELKAKLCKSKENALSKVAAKKICAAASKIQRRKHKHAMKLDKEAASEQHTLQLNLKRKCETSDKTSSEYKKAKLNKKPLGIKEMFMKMSK